MLQEQRRGIILPQIHEIDAIETKYLHIFMFDQIMIMKISYNIEEGNKTNIHLRHFIRVSCENYCSSPP